MIAVFHYESEGGGASAFFDSFVELPKIQFYNEELFSTVAISNLKFKLACSYGYASDDPFWEFYSKHSKDITACSLIANYQTIISMAKITKIVDEYERFAVSFEITADTSDLDEKATNELSITKQITFPHLINDTINLEILQHLKSAFPGHKIVYPDYHSNSLNIGYQIHSEAHKKSLPSTLLGKIKIKYNANNNLELLKSIAKLLYAKVRIDGDTITFTDLHNIEPTATLDGFKIEERWDTTVDKDIATLSECKLYNSSGQKIADLKNIINSQRRSIFLRRPNTVKFEGQLDSFAYTNDIVLHDNYKYIVKDIEYNSTLLANGVY
jgi:hypothetical protein